MAMRKTKSNCNPESNCKPSVTRSRKRRLRQKYSNRLDFETLEPKQLLAGVTVGNAFRRFQCSRFDIHFGSDRR